MSAIFFWSRGERGEKIEKKKERKRPAWRSFHISFLSPAIYRPFFYSLQNMWILWECLKVKLIVVSFLTKNWRIKILNCVTKSLDHAAKNSLHLLVKRQPFISYIPIVKIDVSMSLLLWTFAILILPFAVLLNRSIIITAL